MKMPHRIVAEGGMDFRNYHYSRGEIVVMHPTDAMKLGAVLVDESEDIVTEPKAESVEIPDKSEGDEEDDGSWRIAP